MSTKRSPTLRKFVKSDLLCNICQGTFPSLTEDHVPPRACPPAADRVISKLSYELTGDKSFRPRHSQNGVTFRTLCATCNSILGSRYDHELAGLCSKIESFVESSLKLPDSFELSARPGAIIRSVLGHLLAAKSESDEVVVDSMIRPCVLDQSIPVPESIHLLYWVYPYERTAILRDFVMPAKRGDLRGFGFYSLLKFYPIAFLVSHETNEYEGLDSLNAFNSLDPKAEATFRIQLKPSRKEFWPEECSKDNLLIFGRAAESSVYSVPRVKRHNK